MFRGRNGWSGLSDYGNYGPQIGNNIYPRFFSHSHQGGYGEAGLGSLLLVALVI